MNAVIARDTLATILPTAEHLLFATRFETDPTEAAANLFGVLMAIEDALAITITYFASAPDTTTVAADIEQALLAAQRHTETPDIDAARSAIVAAMDEADQFFGDLLEPDGDAV